MKLSLLFFASLVVAVSFAFKQDESIERTLEENKKKPPKARKEWAVLVAGSDGWGNYRHQADICHAYHILIKRGVPESNIIVLMKDDIANNPENPTPGVIINKPNGTDVYKGVKIDYKGADVNPKTFINVLLGNKKALQKVGTGRVLESGPNDDVFINFADHGGPGVLCFPDEDLSAKDFIATLNKMTKKKKYAKLLLFIEACESGSMFDNLLAENTKILASTAAAYDESSWGYYCEFGEYPCLGDLYSINWMEHFDKKISSKENIFDEYQLIRTLTSKSHSNLYGDYSIGFDQDGEYVGPHDVAASSNSNSNQEERPNRKYTSVPSRDITLHWLKRKVTNAKNSFEKLRYSDIISEVENKRKQVDNTVDAIVQWTVFGNEHLQDDVEGEHSRLSMNMMTCYENLYRSFSKKCFNMFKNPYVVKHFYKFVNICHMDSFFHERAANAINTLCNSETQKITETH